MPRAQWADRPQADRRPLASLRRAPMGTRTKKLRNRPGRPMTVRIDDGKTAGAPPAEVIYVRALPRRRQIATLEDVIMSIRSAIVVVGAIGLAAAFVQAAHADVTFKSQDGALEITLPNGWHEAKQSGPEAKIHVAGQGTRVTVREHAKEDFKDIKAVATFLADRLKKRFTDAEPKFEDVQVNGKPAVRMELEGTEPSGAQGGLSHNRHRRRQNLHQHYGNGERIGFRQAQTTFI